jgi:hypothetical protein
MRSGKLLSTLRCAIVAIALASGPSLNAAGRITGLSDVAFGTINNLGVDSVRAQDVCAYSDSFLGLYRVTATGSGTGGAFTLQAGSRQLPYDVQWSGSEGRTSGSGLTAGVASGWFFSFANQTCTGGENASLIVVLRATDLQSATAGSYSGVLTIMLAPL